MRDKSRGLPFGGALALLLLAGCGAIRTPGTEDLPPEALAEVFVPRHTGVLADDGKEAHVVQVQVGAWVHALGGSGDTFLFPPGKHVLTLAYGACRHWPSTWFRPFDRLLVNCPSGTAELDARAGRRYELRGALLGWNSGPQHRHWFEESP